MTSVLNMESNDYLDVSFNLENGQWNTESQKTEDWNYFQQFIKFSVFYAAMLQGRA